MSAAYPNTNQSLSKLVVYTALLLSILGMPKGVVADDTGGAQQHQTQNFNIPAQPLAQALNAFIEVSDWQVGFPAGVARNVQSSPVKGAFTPSQALAKLLAGTGIAYRMTGTSKATLVTPSPKPVLTPVNQNQDNVVVPNSNADTTLPKVTVEADSAYDPDYYADPYNKDYVIPNATVGTKTDTPIMETPLNVQVISKQVLKDQQAFNMTDALKNVSGVTTNSLVASANQRQGNFGLFGGSDQTLFLRGFESQTFFRNGFRLTEGAASKGFANVESVEVLKGPAAILYGLVEPGGMVNVITKQPLATPYYGFTQQFGSYDLYRTTLDASGPIANIKNLLYRVNLSYENTGSFRQYVGTENVFFAPVVTWNISPKTQATFELEYNRTHQGLDNGFVPAVPDLNLPFNSHTNYGAYSPSLEETIFGGFRWSHQFDDDWELKHSFSVNQRSLNNRSEYPQFAGDKPFIQDSIFTPYLGITDDFLDTLPNHLYAGRNLQSQSSQNNTYATNLDLVGHFDTWDLKHTLLLGGDFYRLDFTAGTLATGIADFGIGQTYLPLPYTGGPAFTPPGIKLVTFAGPTTAATDQFGLYIQDQIKLPFDLDVTGGIRWQYLHNSQVTRNLDGSVSGRLASTQDAVTPRVGLLWHPKNWLSLYANYAESFGSNVSAAGGMPLTYVSNGVGKVIDPTSAAQYEGGIKFQFFDNKLRGTLAYYDLTKNNIAVGDPDKFHNCGTAAFVEGVSSDCSLALGEVRSRGPEIDITGEILPGWNVIATWANTDIKIIKTNPAGDDLGSGFFPGARLPNVPRNKSSFWSTYELQHGDFQGLKFGGGVNITDQQIGSFVNETSHSSVKTPGFVTVDLMTGYSRKLKDFTVSAQLNVSNLLDKQYYTSIQGYPAFQANYVGFGAPRTFMGQISVQY